ncbi:MFS transporter [Saxibacter everestensis]|uniref:MFS transporter n=1 Tax=Saxibacter everestensis TaxID=2909229 RepID=A0ABY8QND8_9MICO|nr:MFS transporter [Brevibacteriaceae bacterium ZFBP1038]
MSNADRSGSTLPESTATSNTEPGSATSANADPSQKLTHNELGQVIIRSARDVSAVLSERGSQQKGALAVIILALGGIFMDAYDFSSLAFGITAVKEEFGLNGFMTGLVNASIMVGAVVGAIAGGYLVDRFGRYRLFMADMVFFVVAALGCAVAPDEWTLIFFRFIMGIGVGLDLPVAMAFLAEFSRLRGKGNRSERVNAWSPAWYAATGVGYLVVLTFFLLLPPAEQGILWRLVVGFGAVPAIIVLLVRRKYMAESPQWLANQGDVRGAVEILRNKYAIDAVLAEKSQLDAAKPPKTSARSFRILFSPKYRLRTTVALCVSVFSTFGYNAVAYGTPLIVTELFQQGPLTTILSSLVINLAFGVGGGLIGMSLVTRLGSRKLALIGFAVQTASLLALAILGIPSGALVIIAVLMLALFIFFQAFGPGAQLMSYATLSYPTSLRGVAVGFNQGVLRSFSIVSLIGFPILSASLGTNVFWVVAIAPLLGTLAVAIIRWDPTGKDVDAEDSYLDEAKQPAQNSRA